MAWTAATPQATVQTALEQVTATKLALEQYVMLVNNPTLLASVNTQVTNCRTALTNLQA
jgi:hypothetical protein